MTVWRNGPDGPYLTAVREFLGRDMATKTIGRATLVDGKLKVSDRTPSTLRKGKAMKAARTEKRLKANREAKR